LIADANPSELDEAKRLVSLISSRGFGSDRDLLKILSDLVTEVRS